jgi:hypothetical protein
MREAEKNVEAAGFEPATSGVRFQRSPSELRPHNFGDFNFNTTARRYPSGSAPNFKVR